jgi:chemotaxis methyl-accepting protein methylase
MNRVEHGETAVHPGYDWAGDRRASGPTAPDERAAFNEIVSHVLRSGGFRFDDHTMNWLRSAILERIIASGAGTARAYLDLLNDASEIQRLHDAIAIRETRFFRRPSDFQLMRDDLLPALWFRRGGTTCLNIWSAGSASGEEAYSLAMAALDAASVAGVTLPSPVRVVGSDIDPAALATAVAGVYGDRTLANVPTEVRARYFSHASGRWRVGDAPRKLVEFQQWSLLDENWPVERGTVDIIYCHDVFAFLPSSALPGIIDRFYRALAPGGYLFLDNPDVVPVRHAGLEAIHLPSATFYQKADRFTRG